MTRDAAVRLDRAGKNAEQGRFAGTVAADQADAVAAQHAGREIARDDLIAEGLIDVLEFGNETTADIRADVAELRRVLRDPLRALLPHLLEIAQAALIALAPRRDALARPDGLGRDALIGARLRSFLGGENTLRPFLERVIAFIELAHRAAIEPQSAPRQALQEGAVMADQQQPGAMGEQPLFQPFDRRNVEMIGRLVEQQDIRIADQHLRQADAPALAP